MTQIITTRPSNAPSRGRAFSLSFILALVLTGLLAAPRSVSALPLGSEKKDTLCGKLVFLENMKTGEKLIGLAPCGQTQPYIFDYRPNELHDYYRLLDVVISKGPAVQTLNFGTLNTYITHFSVSTALQDCNACKISAPTWTPRPEQASLNCADWIIQTSAAQEAAQAPELSQSEKIRFQTNEYAASTELRQQCQGDEACRAQAISIRLGSLLGEIFQRNQLPAEQVIGLMKMLLSDPQQAQTCAASPQAVWHLLVGLDQQGYSIQGLQASTPLTQLVEDYSGRRTGILPDGRLAEEIPGSALVVAGRSKYTLLAAGAAAKISLRGNDAGALDLKVIDFLGKNVWLAAYKQLGISDKTRGELVQSGGGLVLKLDMSGAGSFDLVGEPLVDQYPVTRFWLPTLTPAALPATFTPEPQPSDTATAAVPATEAPPGSPTPVTPAPSGTPGSLSAETPAPVSVFGVPCSSPLGIGLLALGSWLWRRKR
jgi:hypothetical protein